MELEGELGTAYDRLASEERNDGVTEDIKSGPKSGIRGKERSSVASLGRRMTVFSGTLTIFRMGCGECTTRSCL